MTPAAVSNSRALVDRIVVPRRRSYRDPIRFGSGVDFGSDGISLIEIRSDDGQIVKILAWFAGHKTPACGVRGFGHEYVPAQLQISWRNGFESIRLQKGGRLSQTLLRRHVDQIDLHFGPGTLDQVDIRRTLVIADG